MNCYFFSFREQFFKKVLISVRIGDKHSVYIVWPLAVSGWPLRAKKKFLLFMPGFSAAEAGLQLHHNEECCCWIGLFFLILRRRFLSNLYIVVIIITVWSLTRYVSSMYDEWWWVFVAYMKNKIHRIFQHIHRNTKISTKKTVSLDSFEH